MLLGEGYFPEKVIAVQGDREEDHATESRLDLEQKLRARRGAFSPTPLAGEIKKFIDKQRENIENGLIIANKELDGVPDDILGRVREAHGENTPDESLISLILEGSRSRVEELKLKYRDHADQFLKVIEDKANWAAERWLRKITSLTSYANLDEKLTKISKNFNNTIRKAEKEQVEIFNGKFEALKIEFEREMIDFTFRSTTGKNIEEIIREYGDQDEYRERIDQLKGRFKRGTPMDNPVYRFCYDRPLWESILINMGTLGFCNGVGIGALIKYGSGSDGVKAIFSGIILGGIGLFSVATFAITAAWTAVPIFLLKTVGESIVTQVGCLGLDEFLIWSGAYSRQTSDNWSTQDICNYGVGFLHSVGRNLYKLGFENLKLVMSRSAISTMKDNLNVKKISLSIATGNVVDTVKKKISNKQG